jgi:hypothetical protein
VNPTPAELALISTVFDTSDHPECPGYVIPSRLLNGEWIDMWNPDPTKVDIELIAHSLSLLCRYAGQTPFLYTVLQHSILTSGLARYSLGKELLMHDFTEGCGLGDVVSPLKRKNPVIKVVEARMRTALAPKFGLLTVEPAMVKQADDLAYRLERWLLHGFPAPEVDQMTLEWAKECVAPKDPELVRETFLDAYEEFSNPLLPTYN